MTVGADWMGVIVGALTLTAAIAVPLVSWFLKARRQRRREERARLQIETVRWMPNGLRLQFTYRPEFTHMAIQACVSLKSPQVRLYAGRPVLNAAPMAAGGYVKYEFDGEFIDGVGIITLRPMDGSGVLTGVMFLLPDGSGEWVLRRAAIEVSIRGAFGKRLLAESVVVSPIGESPNAAFVVPNQIRSVLS